jgi:hypothetical protein
VDFTHFHETGDAFDRIALALIDRLDRMRKNAEIIGRGNADASVTMIDAERGMGRS